MMIYDGLHILKKEEYLNLRYEIIKQLEESGHENVDIYTDGVGLVTIGVGFNVESSNVLEAVLETGFGLDDVSDFKTGKTFDDLVTDLMAILGQTQLAGQNVSQLGGTKSQLDAKLVEYTNNVTEFKFIARDGKTAVECIEDTFDILAENFEQEFKLGVGSNIF